MSCILAENEKSCARFSWQQLTCHHHSLQDGWVILDVRPPNEVEKVSILLPTLRALSLHAVKPCMKHICLCVRRLESRVLWKCLSTSQRTRSASVLC